MFDIPTKDVSLRPCWRIIPTRVPPVDLFAPIAPNEDWGALMALETQTNQRLRQEHNVVELIRGEDQVSEPGASLIVAPFCHPNPEGEVFSDGSFGVCIVTSTLEEAVELSVQRRTAFLAATGVPPTDVQMRVLNIDLSGTFHDLRGDAGKQFATENERRNVGCYLRSSGSYGVICDEPIAPKGENIYVFRPPVLSNCRQERHLVYRWNGAEIERVYDYSTGSMIYAA